MITTYSYSKASPATALCAYSFAAQPGDTLRRCEGGTFANAVSTSGSSWVELGLYNEGDVPIALATSRANNVVFVERVGDALRPLGAGPVGQRAERRADRPLGARCSGRPSDPESGAPAVAYSIDGGPLVALRGQACSWLCGIAAGGSVAST